MSQQTVIVLVVGVVAFLAGIVVGFILTVAADRSIRREDAEEASRKHDEGDPRP